MVSNATGLWDVSDYGSTPVFCAGEKGNISISKKDKVVLKNLAEKVREISERDSEKEKRKLWFSHNMLKIKKPVVFCDPENGWNEIITDKMIECSGSLLAKKWEMVLRKEIYWAENIKDDKVIEPVFDIGYTYKDNNWGTETQFHGGAGGSYVWDAPINNIEDAKKIKFPEITIDNKTTQDTIGVAQEIFGDVLNVRLTGKWWWSLGLTLDLAFLRGLETIFWDMMDNPDLLHLLMGKLSQGTSKKIDFLSENGLLSSNCDKYVGSGGFGYTEEVLCTDDTKNILPENMWGFCESQETGSVSPAMFEEFVFKYQMPLLEKFGLNCYGCCEPLESRWHIIKRTPNLRRVSVSPWSDLEKMAENLQDKYIFSMKASPSDLAVPAINKDLIRKKIRKALDITRGCVVEILMKDNHTIGKNPENITDWVKIVRQEIGN